MIIRMGDVAGGPAGSSVPTVQSERVGGAEYLEIHRPMGGVGNQGWGTHYQSAYAILRLSSVWSIVECRPSCVLS